MKIDTSFFSPNFNDRALPISMLVLHYTGMENGRVAVGRLCDPEAKVSAHYVVHEEGHIHQLVEEGARAWHAGVGNWRGASDINSASIGIEIVNGGHNFPNEDGLPPYPNAQINAVIALCHTLIERYHIQPWNIVGHSDIAPDRKEDPGEHFPWAGLAAAGIGSGRHMFRFNKATSAMQDNTDPMGVAGAALYLLSDLGLSCTGETHHVDGGFHAIGMPQEGPLRDSLVD